MCAYNDGGIGSGWDIYPILGVTKICTNTYSVSMCVFSETSMHLFLSKL